MLILLITIAVWLISGFLIARYLLQIQELLVLIPTTFGVGIVLHFWLLNLLLHPLSVPIASWLVLLIMLAGGVGAWLFRRNNTPGLTLACSRRTGALLLIGWLILGGLTFRAKLHTGLSDEIDHGPRTTLIAQQGFGMRLALPSYANPEGYCGHYHYAENSMAAVMMRQSGIANLGTITAIRVTFNMLALTGLCFVLLLKLMNQRAIGWAVLGALIFVTIGPAHWLATIHNISFVDNLLPDTAFFERSQYFSDYYNLYPFSSKPMMMSRHDPDLMVSLVYYLAASNPVGAWTVGFLALIGTLSLAQQPHRHPIWYCGLGILVALSALYFFTIVLLIAVPIGLYLLYQLWNDRKNIFPSLLKVSLFSASGLVFLLIQGGTITDAVFCYRYLQPTATTTQQTVTEVSAGSYDSVTQVLENRSFSPVLELIKPQWESDPGYEGRTFESREWERVRFDRPSNSFTILLDWGIGLFIYPVVLLYMILRRNVFVSLILGVGFLSLIFPFVGSIPWVGMDNYRLSVLPLWLGGAFSVIPMRDLWQSNNIRLVKRIVICGFVFLMIFTGTSYLLIWSTMPPTPSTIMAPIDYTVREEWLGKPDPFQERVYSPSFDTVTGYARAIMVFGTYGNRDNGYNNPDNSELGIIAWQLFGLAGDLKASGYSYLYVDENWLSNNFSQQRALLENLKQYELIETWNDPSTGDVRSLYRLLGDEQLFTDTATQNLATYGLGEENLEAFLQYESSFGITSNDRVFNPGYSLLFNNAGRVAALLGGMLEEGISPYSREATFDWIQVLSINQAELALGFMPEEKSQLDEWRRTRLPGYLKTLGYDYLGFDAQWLSLLSDEELAILSNTQNYELLGTWQIPIGNEMDDFYFLYRVIGDDTP